MKNIITILLLFSTIALQAQNLGAEGTTRAVIIGISDYQNEAIPDLRFADKDAEAFAEYLRSSAGGQLANDQIKVLTNEQATMAAIAGELDWLVEESKEGDQAIIYFSGHGDVEAKTARQPGFLLTYDSPPKIYIAGAYPLFYLQLIIETLSTDKNVQTLVITDACRAGKLAGSEIGGTQATAANLAKQYANEIKILSCQPNEFSLEGEQWGGGRGVFSYHLIEGLIGLADKNENYEVNLLELENYLENTVPNEAAPQSQIPMTLGNKGTSISLVDESILSELIDLKEKQLPTLAAIASRGIEETVLASIDSSLQQKYKAFVAALDSKHLMNTQDGNPSADDLYRELIQKEALADLHRLMTRQLATALQDDAQQAINAYLLANPVELKKRWQGDVNYTQYPRYLGRAAELLGESHYMYKYLIAKKLYFEGLNLRLKVSFPITSDSLIRAAIKKQEAAVALEDRAAYFYNELGVLHASMQLDKKAFEYYDKAIALAPEWALPYANYAVSLYYIGDFEKAIEYGEKAGELSGDFPQIYSFLAWIYANNWSNQDKTFWNRTGTELQDNYRYELLEASNKAQAQKRLSKSIELLQKAEALDSSNTNVLFNLGWVNMNAKNHKEAIHYFKKVATLDSLNAEAFAWLASNQLSDNNHEAAEKNYLKAIAIDSTAAHYLNNLSIIYWSQGKFDQSNQLLIKAQKLAPTSISYANIGRNYWYKNLSYDAEAYFLKGILFPFRFSGKESRPEAYLNIAALYKDNFHRYEEAIDMYQMALTIAPDNIEALRRLIEIYVELKKPDKTDLIVEQFEQLCQKNEFLYLDLAGIYLKIGATEKANKILQEKTDTFKDHPEYMISAAWAFQNYSDAYQEAEHLFLKALSFQGDTTKCYAGLGYTYLRDGKDKKAWTYFQKTLERDSSAKNHYHIASYYGALNQNTTALKWLEKSFQKGYSSIWELQMDKDLSKVIRTPAFDTLARKYFPEVFTSGGQFVPVNKEVHFIDNCVSLGRIYDYAKMPEKAKLMYQKALTLKKDKFSDKEKLALAFAYLKLDKIKEAKAILPDYVEATDEGEIFDYGVIYFSLHRPEVAEQYFEQYSERKKTLDQRVLLVLSHYYFQGEEEQTEKYMRKAFKKWPEIPSTYVALGVLKCHIGKYEEGEKILNEGIENAPFVFLDIVKAFMMAHADPEQDAAIAFKEIESILPTAPEIVKCINLYKRQAYNEAGEVLKSLKNKTTHHFVTVMLQLEEVRILAALENFDAAMEIIKSDSLNLFNFQFLQNDPGLARLRETAQFQAHMRKTFPGKMND